MVIFIRHLTAVLLMPFVVAVLVPRWLTAFFAAHDSHWPAHGIVRAVGSGTGVILLAAGFLLFIWCILLFARVGRGTLAPWDPTQKLVSVGPYAYVRNPMIGAVALTLVGQALIRGSWIIGIWAGLFICINHLYFIVSEEPGLEKRFGTSYRAYKEHVPRWIPRLRPWKGR